MALLTNAPETLHSQLTRSGSRSQRCCGRLCTFFSCCFFFFFLFDGFIGAVGPHQYRRHNQLRSCLHRHYCVDL